jgi:uracil-DNA glycosylase
MIPLASSFHAPLAEATAALPAAWRRVLQPYFDAPAWSLLCSFVDARCAAGAVIFPATPFRALALTPPERVRVVILGQDPYHGAGQANGLAFSVSANVRPPPSLRNIFKELQTPARTNGDLSAWAEQGVLLLNTCLTVEEGQAASHAKRGWEAFTDRLIAHLGAQAKPLFFLLWGAHAQAKRDLIAAHHTVLTANHPSPLSALRPPAPFMGCGHFVQVNAQLQVRGEAIIDWNK